jgi:hypothetical protein
VRRQNEILDRSRTGVLLCADVMSSRGLVAETRYEALSGERLPTTIADALTATVAAVILVVLSALNQRYFA